MFVECGAEPPLPAEHWVAEQAGSTNTFAGTTSQISSAFTLNAADTLVNFNHNGTMVIPAANLTAAANGFINNSGGRITIGSSTTNGATFTVTDFTTNGLINLTAGGTGTTQRNRFTNTSTSDMYFGGGSRTFIASVGSPTRSAFFNLGGRNGIVSGGLIVNNGTVSNGQLIVDYGGLVKGAGTYTTAPLTQNGGVFQAGNSPGRAEVGSAELNSGGIFLFQINNATGTPGPSPNMNNQVSGWSLVESIAFDDPDIGVTTGNLSVTATPASKYTLQVQTLINPTTVGNDVPGNMANFNASQTYNWLWYTYQGTYTGPGDINSVITINTTGFSNAA